LPNQQLLEGLDFRAYYTASAKRPSTRVSTNMLGSYTGKCSLWHDRWNTWR